MRLFRDPFVQFLLVGGIVFAVYAYVRTDDADVAEKRILIDSDTQAWLHSNFTKQFRRPPTQLEMGALIRNYTTNEVKYREALAMGLDQRDSIVRRRMMQKFDFLFGDSAAIESPGDEDGEEELERWYAEHKSEFRLPARISFEHRWFSPDRHGDSAAGDATDALTKIADTTSPAPASEFGDPFPLDAELDHVDRDQVRRVFGEAFATALFETDNDAPTGQWFGPVQSGLGYHLVRVSKRSTDVAPMLAEVRDVAIERWREQNSKKRLAEMINTFQGQYEVTLDEESLTRFEYTPESDAIQVGFGTEE
jgi:hypothetical protein